MEATAVAPLQSNARNGNTGMARHPISGPIVTEVNGQVAHTRSCIQFVKPLFWIGRSRHEVRAFARDARHVAGYQLERVQSGMEPADWRPMTAIGAGVCEIRIHAAVEHRVLYVAAFPEAVYVLHAFQKKARRTPRLNLAVARARWRALIRLRESRNG